MRVKSRADYNQIFVFITVCSDVVVAASDGFFTLTGYSADEIKYKPIDDVLSSMLKIRQDALRRLKLGDSLTCFLFTKDGIPKSITLKTNTLVTQVFKIELVHEPSDRRTIEFDIMEQLFADDFLGAAIYDAQDLQLLKANKNFIRYIDPEEPEFCKYAGKQPAELGSYGQQVEPLLRRALQLKKMISVDEIPVSTAYGDIDINYRIVPFVVAGEVRYVFETTRDVTARVKDRLLREAQARELKAQKEKLEAIIENMSDQLIVVNPNGYFELFNKAARDSFNPIYGPVKHIGETSARVQYFDKDNNEVALSDLPITRVLNGEKFNRFRFKIKHLDTTILEVNASPILDESGQVAYGVVCCRDITDIVTAADTLREKTKRMQESMKLLKKQAILLNLSNDAIYACEDGGTIRYWNTGAEKMYGYQKREAVGKKGHSILKTSYPDLAAVQQMLYDKGQWQGVVRQITKGGSEILVESNLKLLRDEAGNEIVLHSNRDVTERIRMENELRESEFSLRMAAQIAVMGTFSYDFSARKGRCSQTFKSFFNISDIPDDQLDFSQIMAAIHREDRDRLLLFDIVDSVDGGTIDQRFRVIRHDGSIRWLHLIRQAQYSAGGQPTVVAGVLFDITDKVAATDEIIRFSQQLQSILDNADDLIISIDAEKRFSTFNHAAYRYVRENTGQALRIGMKISELKEGAARFTEVYERARRYGKFEIDLRSLKTNQIINYTVTPLYINKEFDEVVIYGKDITERNRTECEIIKRNSSLETLVEERTKKLRDSLKQMQDFSMAISHEMKTPLREIEYYAKHILEHSDIDESVRKVLDVCSRKLVMIDRLYEYAMITHAKLKREKINVRKMIQAVHEQLKTSMGLERAKLVFETGFPPVDADRELFTQMIINIVSNALKFSSGRETPQLSAGCREEDKEYVFYFKDNGVGFNQEYSKKLFGLFERLHTKDEFEGSGIGLAHTKNIVERHGGRIWINGVENSGAVISFTLPITDGA